MTNSCSFSLWNFHFSLSTDLFVASHSPRVHMVNSDMLVKKTNVVAALAFHHLLVRLRASRVAFLIYVFSFVSIN